MFFGGGGFPFGDFGKSIYLNLANCIAHSLLYRGNAWWKREERYRQ